MATSKKRIKYQTVPIIVPAGTNTATVLTAKDYLDSAYNTATALSVVKVSGTDPIAIGVRTQSDQVLDLVHSSLWVVNEQTPVQGRWTMTTNIPAQGKEITIQAQPLVAAPAGTNIFHVVFRLEE